MRLGISALAIGLLSTSLALAAPTPLFEQTGSILTNVIGGHDGTIGFSFSVTQPITISGLGIFDVGSDGLLNSHNVGLWTSSGTGLAGTVVDNSANAIASSAPFGRWLEVDIAPLTLGVGTYVIGAFYLDSFAHSEDQAIFGAPSAFPAGVAFGTMLGNMTTGLAMPTGIGPSNQVAFGPMLFQDVASVPEPAAIALFAIGGICIALAGKARRRPSRTLR